MERFSVEQVLEKISALVVGLDSRGNVMAWNTAAQRALGLSSAEVMGRPLAALTLPLHDPHTVQQLLSAANGEQAVRIDEVGYVRPDGSEGLLGLTASPMVGERGERRQVLVLGRDITDQRGREVRGQQSEKLESIGQLAAGIAHEINTPLQALQHNLWFLREAFDDLTSLARLRTAHAAGADSGMVDVPQLSHPLRDERAAYLMDEVPRALAQALDTIDRVGGIVRAMRRMASPDPSDKVESDLNAAIEAAVTLSTHEWRYVADLDLDLDPALPRVTCHIGALTQVLLALLVNAADAIKRIRTDDDAAKGKITISSRRRDVGVLVRISDSGIGIPAHLRGRIFELFYTTKDLGTKTANALSSVRTTVVEDHHGSIEVDSEPGCGTTFSIWLPVRA